MAKFLPHGTGCKKNEGAWRISSEWWWLVKLVLVHVMLGLVGRLVSRLVFSDQIETYHPYPSGKKLMDSLEERLNIPASRSSGKLPAADLDGSAPLNPTIYSSSQKQVNPTHAMRHHHLYVEDLIFHSCNIWKLWLRISAKLCQIICPPRLGYIYFYRSPPTMSSNGRCQCHGHPLDIHGYPVSLSKIQWLAGIDTPSESTEKKISLSPLLASPQPAC